MTGALLADGGLWRRLGERFAAGETRPRLASGVELRPDQDGIRLMRGGERLGVDLTDEDVRLVERFDGSRTVSELIVEELDAVRTFSIGPVISLLDRLSAVGALERPNLGLYERLAAELERQPSTATDRPPSSLPGLDALRRLRERFARDSSPFEPPSAPPDVDLEPESDVTPAPATVPETQPPDVRPGHVPRRPSSTVLAERLRVLKGVVLLAALSDRDFVDLAERVREETHPAASPIVREGDEADRLYIIRSGTVIVSHQQGAAEDASAPVVRLGAGQWFGEIGLLEGSARNATVRASAARPVQLYSVDAAAFDEIVAPHVEGGEGRRLVSRRRAQLARVPLFRSLASSDLDRLAQVLEERLIHRGTVLFRQGETGDRFYVIVEGAVGVVKNGEPIARLGPGEFFGETALLFTETRTATVATTEDTTFWTLDRASFTDLVREALLHRREHIPTVLGRVTSSDPL